MAEVEIDHGIDQAMAGYRKFLEEAPKSSLTPEAMRQMMAYHWPGNVRELRNAVEYAFVLCHGSSVGPEHLPERVNICSGPTNKTARECTEISMESGVNKSLDEKNQLIHALKTANGNQSRAALAIGVSRVTIWKRIKKHGIDLQRDLD